MKQWIEKGLLFCFLGSLLSCASTMNLLIEVEKPAAFTLPVKVQDVIIVNNTLPQPVGYGLNPPSGKYPEDDSIYVKTLKNASWQLITKTFNQLKSSEFFSNVSFYKKLLREDDEWLSVVPLKKEVLKDFLEDEHFDLLISIDRLLFNPVIHSNSVESGNMKILLTFSAYLYDRDEPVINHLTITDSVKAYYNKYDDNYDPSRKTNEYLVSEMIRYSTTRLSEKLGYFFAPRWESAERIYFVKNLHDMGKTAGYIDKGTWAKAKTDWTNAFETAKKAVDKARLATNIALAYEMTDDFGIAETWAKKAETFFQEASPTKYAKEIKYLDKYIESLQERKQNNILLNKQL
ncbi:MAG: DUF6340 family protein [Dysgonamonadaceae bacterium]|jgi:hypothetical protein|nr:DUF6340 family protein [Dysgonamonadaceae bacterium]